jgi:hypothetical protein
MQGLKVFVEYLDGSTSEDEIPVSYAPGQEHQACIRLLGAINSTGGLMLFEKDGITLRPFAAMRSIKITAPTIVGADVLDLSRLDAQVARTAGGVTL